VRLTVLQALKATFVPVTTVDQSSE